MFPQVPVGPKPPVKLKRAAAFLGGAGMGKAKKIGGWFTSTAHLTIST
jgi:hypothetical protein